MIGDTDRMPPEALDRLNGCIESTSHCSGLTLCLALSYSARWELAEAVRRISNEVADRRLAVGDIDEHTVSRFLTTASMPDPDLLIRTGGDQRIYGRLLIQRYTSHRHIGRISPRSSFGRLLTPMPDVNAGSDSRPSRSCRIATGRLRHRYGTRLHNPFAC